MFYMILALILAYLIGSIPSGLLIGKFYGIDIRTVGSHNIGATNVTRSISKKAGIFCFVCDFFKGAIPVWIAPLIDPHPATTVLCCMFAVIGHMFPLYLKFKGGKGVATGAGGAFALAPVPLLIAFAVWGAVFHFSRYVSLASIVAAIILPVSALLIRLSGSGHISWFIIILFAVIGSLAVYRHKSNIVRLMNGTESRFERKKKDSKK